MSKVEVTGSEDVTLLPSETRFFGALQAKLYRVHTFFRCQEVFAGEKPGFLAPT